jgi:hypothetical protein
MLGTMMFVHCAHSCVHIRVHFMLLLACVPLAQAGSSCSGSDVGGVAAALLIKAGPALSCMVLVILLLLCYVPG